MRIELWFTVARPYIVIGWFIHPIIFVGMLCCSKLKYSSVYSSSSEVKWSDGILWCLNGRALATGGLLHTQENSESGSEIVLEPDPRTSDFDFSIFSGSGSETSS